MSKVINWTSVSMGAAAGFVAGIVFLAVVTASDNANSTPVVATQVLDLAPIEKKVDTLATQQAALIEALASTKSRQDICDRSILMQEKLLDLHNVNLCRYVGVEELSRIQGLSIEEEGNRLEAGDFAGMDNLRGLSLSKRRTSQDSRDSGFELPADLLSGITSLDYLGLTGYTMESVTAPAFVEALPRLDILEINHHWEEENWGSGRYEYTINFQPNFPPCLEHDGGVTDTASGREALILLHTAFDGLTTCEGEASTS